METTTAPIRNTFQAPADVRDANSHRFYADSVGRYADQCFMCGRPLSPKAVESGWWVHLLVDDTLAPWGDPAFFADHREDGVAASQGAFPVGSECARRIPAGYKGRFTVQGG